MFVYDKKLQYPVKIANANPRLAAMVISQYGGPDGELGASLRYLSQRYSMPYPALQAVLTDIGTEGSILHAAIQRKCPLYWNMIEPYCHAVIWIDRHLIQEAPVKEVAAIPARNNLNDPVPQVFPERGGIACAASFGAGMNQTSL